MNNLQDLALLPMTGLALVAGVISITAPCSLPLIPGYLSYISGVSTSESHSRRRVLGTAGLFVLGFALVFTALGASASAFGSFLLDRLGLFLRIAGVFVIVMGFAMIGLLRIPFLQREHRFAMHRLRRGPAGAVPLGMAFAFGWTPCIGPILGAVFLMAAASGTLVRGSFLLLVYSVGMGIPFVAIAYAYSRAGGTLKLLNRFGRQIEIAGGGLLVLMGVLMLTGTWTALFAPVVRWFARLGWPPI